MNWSNIKDIETLKDKVRCIESNIWERLDEIKRHDTSILDDAVFIRQAAIAAMQEYIRAYLQRIADGGDYSSQDMRNNIAVCAMKRSMELLAEIKKYETE